MKKAAPITAGNLLGRIPPNSLDAEMALLGAMMLSPLEVCPVVQERVRVEVFYYSAHQAVFREICSMVDNLNALDLVTLTERLQAKNLLEEIGGAPYLTDLVSRCPTTANFEHYIDIVEEKHRRRQLISAAFELTQSAFDENQSLEEIHKTLAMRLGELTSGRSNITDMRTAIRDVMGEIETVITSERHITGLSTGFDKLDEITFGLNAPDFWILAGRPSDGKTALACCIAANVASQGNIPVGIISLEQNTRALAKRILASWSGVNMRKLKAMTESDTHALTGAAEKLCKLPIYFDDRPALTANQIRTTARIMQRKYGCQMFVVDYLQLSRADERCFSRNEEVAKISAVIKATSKELNAPFLVLSQLNRKDGRPNLTSLRDSGAIEQDADVVIFINRDLTDEDLPHYWHKKFSKGELDALAQLDIAKQREGERDKFVYLRFDREFTRFTNLDTSPKEPALL